MPKDTLNPKQLAFCQEYTLDHNGTQAAIRAGYSENTAQEQSAQLLSKLIIKNQIDILETAIKSERKELKQRLIDELTLIAEYDINDYIEVVPVTVEMRDRENNLVSYETEVIRLKEGCNGKAISKIKMGQGGLEVTFHDKTKAIELLGKHICMFNEEKPRETEPAEVVIE